MNTNITSNTIKRLREAKGITQSELADLIGVSSKAVSKWETAKGLPDISLIEPLSKVLGVSVMELMSGDTVTNNNISANILRSKIYVCPVCSNIIYSCGDALVSCCGHTLFPLQAVDADESHKITLQRVENEHFITIDHDMTKTHYISFVAYVSSDSFRLIKFYPEGNAQTRLELRGSGFLYLYCNKHGLMKQKI
ncbi:MAG: helix-turn-helix domain-containing protein [Eubacterium sp.]